MARLVGWRERVHLPDLGVRLVAKLDTGALSSVLHVDDVVVADGRVRGRIPLDREGRRSHPIDVRLAGWCWVKDSGGHGSMRPLVRCVVRLGDEVWEEDVTLYPRTGMQHRLLLGRRALRGRFVVDAAKAFTVQDVAATTAA